MAREYSTHNYMLAKYVKHFMLQNFGILIAFGVGFLGIFLAMTQINTSLSISRPLLVFKRDPKSSNNPKLQSLTGSVDEEHARDPAQSDPSFHCQYTVDGEALVSTSSTPDTSGDMFTWQHLQYEIPVGKGQTRRLLDDVSGYVEPGKLTALMGSSGAGKVSTSSSQRWEQHPADSAPWFSQTTLLNVLAQRVSVGVVTGQCLVNGQSLPFDFQAQT